MSSRKIVFFDIDGTLWDQKMRIPDSTKSAVRILRSRGGLAFLCTGRSRANITSQELLGLGFDGMVAACGCHIEIGGKRVYEKHIAPDRFLFYRDVLSRCRMPVVFEGPDYCWFDPEDFRGDPYIDYLIDQLGPAARRVDDMTEGDLVNKFSTDILPETDFDGVSRAVEGEMNVIVHGGQVAEYVPAGTSKASGIEKVLSYYGIPREDSYGIGDGNNDVEMISFVGNGIAMGNASKALKERADYVTRSVRDDGVFHALAHYDLI